MPGLLKSVKRSCLELSIRTMNTCFPGITGGITRIFRYILGNMNFLSKYLLQVEWIYQKLNGGCYIYLKKLIYLSL